MGNDIQQHFQNIHAIIRQGRTRALAAATFYSLETYWNVGAYLQHRLNERSYGKKIVGELGEWLQTQEPGLKGFDRRSLYRMREFFEAWADADWEIAGLSKSQNMNPSIVLFEEEKIVVTLTLQSLNIPWPLTKISWTHHKWSKLK